MINIWRIGSWPGIREDTKENRKKFALEYAIPYNFIAIGSGYLPDVKGWTIEEIRDETDKKSKAKNRAKTVNYFVNEMKIGDIVFLDLDGKEGYMGEIASDYYWVQKNSSLDFIRNTSGYNYAPHRRDVCWKYKDKSGKAESFSDISFGLNGAVNKIKDEQISQITNSKVKKYLKAVRTLPYLVNE